MRRVATVAVLCLAGAAAWLRKTELPEPRQRPVVRRAILEQAPPVQSIPSARIGAQTVGESHPPPPDRSRRFPVKVEGMVIDEETGLLIDDARVRVAGGTGDCQWGNGWPRAGGGFEMSLTGGPGLEVDLGVDRDGYDPECVRVVLEGEWVALPPIRLRPRHERFLSIRGTCADARTGERISEVRVALHVTGTASKPPWHPAQARADGGFEVTLRAESGLVGDVALLAPGYRPVLLHQISLQGPTVELPVATMESAATPLP